MNPNPIKTDLSFIPLSHKKCLTDGVTEQDLERAAGRLADETRQAVEGAMRGMFSGSTNSTSDQPAPLTIDRLNEIRAKMPKVRRIAGITTRPDTTAWVQGIVKADDHTPGIFNGSLFPVTELARQGEPYLVFEHFGDYLRHVALMTLEVGDIVVSINPGQILRTGCGSYEDAVVACLEPFTLISREGDMMWSATIKPEWFKKTGTADKMTWAAVAARMRRDAAHPSMTCSIRYEPPAPAVFIPPPPKEPWRGRRPR